MRKQVYSPNLLQIDRIDVILKTLVYAKDADWLLLTIAIEPLANSNEVTVNLMLVDQDKNILHYIVNPLGGYTNDIL